MNQLLLLAEVFQKSKRLRKGIEEVGTLGLLMQQLVPLLQEEKAKEYWKRPSELEKQGVNQNQ